MPYVVLLAAANRYRCLQQQNALPYTVRHTERISLWYVIWWWKHEKPIRPLDTSSSLNI